MKTLVLLHPDEAIRESLAHLLRAEGHAIHTASTSAQAVDFCRTERPTIIITSLTSYWHDGASREIVSHLRTEFPELTIITLSGDGTKDAEQRAKSLGATRHFRTPFAFAALVDAINQSAMSATDVGER